MKKTMKRALSMLLLIVMVITMLPENMLGNKITTTVKAETQSEEEYTLGDDTPIWTVGEDETEVISEDTASDLPSSVDNSTTKYFPAIGNQGSIGSCTCWAEVYYDFTYTLCKARDVAATGNNVMSPIFIYNHIRENGSSLSSSGSSYAHARTMLQDVGACSYNLATGAQDSTYLTWFPTEEVWENAVKNRLTSSTTISNPSGQITSPKDSDLDQIKSYLAEGNLITYSSFDPNPNKGWFYTTIPSNSPYAGENICTHAKYSSTGSHRMTIVGYNDNIFVDINGDGVIQTAEKGAFKVANSWGTSWSRGNSGFCWVSYDALNAISSVLLLENINRYTVFWSMSMMKVNSQTDVSGVNLKATLNTSKRKQVTMKISATDNNGVVKSYDAAPFELRNWGEVALNGSSNAADGTIVIDLNNVISNISSSTLKNYEWTVTVKDDSADSNGVIVKNLTIEDNDTDVYLATVDNTAIDGTSKTYAVNSIVTPTVAPTTTPTVAPTATPTVAPTATPTVAPTTTPTATPTVAPTATPTVENVVNVYYYNSSYSNAYIHYQDANNQWTTVPGVQMSTSNEQSGYTWKYTIDLGTKSSTQVCFNNGSGSWDSRNGANYTVYAGNYGIKNATVTKLATPTVAPTTTPTATPTVAPTATVAPTVTPTISPTATPQLENVVNVYYYNSSYSNAYIHYRIGSGAWTTVPGVAMSTSSEQDGYTWKYTIDLGTESSATVCFNNGSGSWDSNNGSNYTVYAGDYGIKNSTVTKLESSKALAVTALTSDVASPQKLGAAITLTATIANEATYQGSTRTFTVAKVGMPSTEITLNNYQQTTATWTPTEAGQYIITFTVTDSTGAQASKTMFYSITDETNTVTIYYSGLSNAYIHYKIGDGAWTTVPGVQMETTTEMTGYSYKAVIDLGDATTLTACFNNGSGTWDSRSGANYSFESGTYTVKDQTITKID